MLIRGGTEKGLMMKVLPALTRHFEQMLGESRRGCWCELGGVLGTCLC